MFEDLDQMREWMAENEAFWPKGAFLGLGHRFTETRAVVPAGEVHEGPVWHLEPWDGEQPLTIPHGMEDAILGVCGHIAVLSQERALILLGELLDCDPQAALEWFEYNTIGSWIGEETPIFLEKPGE
jgi:hypothetical protein